MINSKKIKSFLLQMMFALIMIVVGTTNAYAEYNSIYFDARFDTENWRLVVYPRERGMDGGKGYEDEYVGEWYVKTHGNAGEKTYQDSRSSDDYWEAMRPKNDLDEPYNNGNLLSKMLALHSPNRTGVSRMKAVSKKNTIPAALYTYEEGGTTYGHSGIPSWSKRAAMLQDSICGERDLDEGKGYSMVRGFNLLLEKIETLRGGYTEETFKETVMGLAWMLSPRNERSYVIFEVTGQEKLGDDVEFKENNNPNEDDEEEEVNTTDPTKADYVGNGNDIRVSRGGESSDSGYKRNIYISQKDEKGEWKLVYSHRQAYRLSTGYDVVDDKISEDGEAKIKITDAELSKENESRIYTAAAGSTLVGLNAEDVEFITLYDLIYDAFVKYENGTTSDGTEEGASDNLITRIVLRLFDELVDFVESQLGMSSIEDLVYNREDREHVGIDGYVLGLFPRGWLPLIRQALSMVSIISILFLTFAILRILYLMNLDSMNVTTRLNLKQDILNVIYSVLGMMLFMTFFYVLGLLNYKLTNILYTTISDENISFTSTFTSGGGLVGGIILRLVMLCVTGYMNVVYIIRSINIGVLLVLAPIFIIGTAFNGVDRIKVFGKELVANIFIQTLHALLLVFIAKARASMIGTHGGTNVFISIVMTTSLITVTNMFKDLVFGESKSLLAAGRVAESGKNTLNELGRRGTILAAGITGGSIAAGTKLATREQFNKFNKFKEKQKMGAVGNLVKDVVWGDKASGGIDSSSSSGDSGGVSSSSSSGESRSSSLKNAGGNADNVNGVNSESEGKINVNGSNKYYDSDLKEGFRKRDRLAVEVANNVNNMSNLIKVLKSGGDERAVNNFVNGVNDAKEMRKYMSVNSTKNREAMMNSSVKEASSSNEKTGKDGGSNNE